MIVVIVAAAIVITIVKCLHPKNLRLKLEPRSVGGREGARADRHAFDGVGRINDSGIRILHSARALRKVAVGKMTLTIASLSNHGAWGIALIIGLVAALAVAALLVLLIRAVDDIERSATSLLWKSPSRVAGNITANIPQLQATAPVARRDRRRSGDPGWVHERPHRRLPGGEPDDSCGHRIGEPGRRAEASMSSTTLTILSVLLAIVIIAVLAAALIRIRIKLEVHVGDAGDAGRGPRRGGVRAPSSRSSRP